jgi:hypothetical protein
MAEVSQERSHRTRLGLLAAVLGLLAVLSVATGIGVTDAEAADVLDATDVSCDGQTIKTGNVSVRHTGGTMAITQRSTTPKSPSAVWYRNTANGNFLQAKQVADGGTVSWGGVLAATYEVRVRRAVAENCNGISPGHGNYRFNYTATFQG